MNTINKTDIAERISPSPMENATTEETIKKVFVCMAEELAAGNEVSIHGFGKFVPKERAARSGTVWGKPWTSEASIAVGFKPSSNLKDKVNA